MAHTGPSIDPSLGVEFEAKNTGEGDFEVMVVP